jgi:hypothetical protein
MLHGHSVGQLDIYYVGSGVETPWRLGVADVERTCQYHIIVRDLRGLRLKDQLAEAWGQAGFGPSADEGDLRWVCVFSDTKHTQLLTVALEDSGRRGSMNGVPVVSNGAFAAFLERLTSSLWQGEYQE